MDRSGPEWTGMERRGKDRKGHAAAMISKRTGQERMGEDRTGSDRSGEDRKGTTTNNQQLTMKLIDAICRERRLVWNNQRGGIPVWMRRHVRRA